MKNVGEANRPSKATPARAIRRIRVCVRYRLATEVRRFALEKRAAAAATLVDRDEARPSASGPSSGVVVSTSRVMRPTARPGDERLD